ncbi:MAG TPA: cupin domain-containing protein [Aestuariivirga sp.]|nr:cupin domain-containing protein [Aestuariivirga sp.]
MRSEPQLKAAVTQASEWLDNAGRFQGEWQGGSRGAGICVIANRLDTVGGGPRLHRHPYAEIFVVRLGTGIFTIGSTQVEASTGQILVVPSNTAHKFSNAGPEPLETIDIHESGKFITEWLE